MGEKIFHKLFLLVVLMNSCTTTNISKYYFDHQPVLDKLHQSYSVQYSHNPFSLEYVDKSFNNISIEIFTDTMKYIYVFQPDEMRLKDTLAKYHLVAGGISELLTGMRAVHCNWINNLDYYVDQTKNSLVFMSIRPMGFHFPFKRKKYYILSYFSQPQYYDKEGRLLDKKRRRKIRKINEDVFKRITDKVAYTISDRYR
ncbi:MAG: hypothetical protein ABJA57_02475 [Ginsengibacter sp.]